MTQEITTIQLKYCNSTLCNLNITDRGKVSKKGIIVIVHYVILKKQKKPSKEAFLIY